MRKNRNENHRLDRDSSARHLFWIFICVERIMKKEQEVEYAVVRKYEGEDWIDIECYNDTKHLGFLIKVSSDYPNLADDIRWYINESHRARA
jgi:hypothetical protein